MEPATRIIINTIAQYCRSLITMALAFVTTRIVFQGLGVTDYGIFSVVGGLVTMLGFVTNSLVITTQRNISYYFGKGNDEDTKKVFVNSLLIHLVIALSIALFLMLLKDFFINQWLNIPPSRIDVAGYVFIITVSIMAFVVITAPFRALFVARENIVFISVVEIIDALIKFVLIIGAFQIEGIDRLVAYSNVMAMVTLLNLVVFAGYAISKYQECTIIIRNNYISKKYLKELTNFAGWTTIDTASAVLRTQGTAVILNNFLGTAINASYGIANQIKTASSFIFTSILNAMSPQIMKAEGAGEREKMLKLATLESKYSTSIMIISILPIVFELPALITLWLGKEPEHASMFCTFLIVAFLADGLSLGLHVANQALGNIGTYTLIVNIPKILSLFFVWISLYLDYPVVYVMWIYLTIETLVSFSRIPYTYIKTGMSMIGYLKQAVLPLMILALSITIYCELIIHLFEFNYRFLLTCPSAILIGIVTMWTILLNKSEKDFIKSLIYKKEKNHKNTIR